MDETERHDQESPGSPEPQLEGILDEWSERDTEVIKAAYSVAAESGRTDVPMGRLVHYVLDKLKRSYPADLSRAEVAVIMQALVLYPSFFRSVDREIAAEKAFWATPGRRGERFEAYARAMGFTPLGDTSAKGGSYDDRELVSLYLDLTHPDPPRGAFERDAWYRDLAWRLGVRDVIDIEPPYDHREAIRLLTDRFDFPDDKACAKHLGDIKKRARKALPGSGWLSEIEADKIYIPRIESAETHRT